MKSCNSKHQIIVIYRNEGIRTLDNCDLVLTIVEHKFMEKIRCEISEVF